MSESVLIIGTPDSCRSCGFSGYDGDNCFATRNDILEDIYMNNQKMDNCPLRLLPERKISKYSDAGNQYRNGWNACLDGIYKLDFETEEDADGTEKNR